MAPPPPAPISPPAFPVTSLPQRVHTTLDKLSNAKSRKLARDFDLKRDCELRELVQYSCTPWEDSLAMSLEGKRQQCWPVVRLFRRCGEGGKMFHVETTAWEGEGAWKKEISDGGSGTRKDNGKIMAADATSSSTFANYGSYFWSKQS